MLAFVEVFVCSTNSFAEGVAVVPIPTLPPVSRVPIVVGDFRVRKLLVSAAIQNSWGELLQPVQAPS